MTGNPFRSFWMAGYECSDQLNVHGERVDLLLETQHTRHVNADYEALRPFNIKTVREGIRWSQVEKSPYKYDWSAVKPMLEAAKRCNIQQIWDLCHFGFPDDLTPLHPLFARRFSAMCCSFAHFYYEHTNAPLIVTPINEVSFLSWLGGEVGATVPYCTGWGWQVKYRLMRAYIAAVAALKESYPGIIILSTEPLVNIVGPLNGSPEEILEAAIAHEDQFQAIDMLTGRICPELGGCPEYLDVIGLNFYHGNQFELYSRSPLPWVNTSGDPRWQPLRDMLMNVYQRYNTPFILAETSHPGEHRSNWITHVAEECSAVIQQNAPLWGVCLYPVISRPDWDHLHIWHNSGLWDVSVELAERTRILDTDYALALQHARMLVAQAVVPDTHVVEDTVNAAAAMSVEAEG